MQCASLLRSTCTNLAVAPANLTTVWQTSSGDVYRVDYTTRLDQPDWQSLGVVTASAEHVHITDTNAALATTRFHRMISLP